MKKNRLCKIIIIPLILLLVVGCQDNKKENTNTSKIDSSKYSTKGLTKTSCYRETETEEGTNVDIKIELFSDKDGYLKILKTKEVVTSDNSDVLKEYSDAYKKVYSVYEDIDYYDNVVENSDTKVTSTTYINYGKVDMDKIIEIEGTENNVKMTDGKIKLEDWKSFAKKYGTTCSK